MIFLLRMAVLSSLFALPILATQETDELIQFKAGDRLPVVFQAEGDLLETVDATPSYVTVKQGFWIRIKNDQILASLDGKSFKPFNSLFDGSLQFGAGPKERVEGIAKSINIGFKAVLK